MSRYEGVTLPEGIPIYYVREETVAGSLYFWPRPAVRNEPDHSWNPETRDITWFDDEGNQAQERSGYVVTTTRTPTLTAMWPKRPTLSHFARKSEEDMSPVARTLVAADPATYPVRIERAEWESRCEYGPDSDCTDCTWHQVRDGIYERVMTEPSTGQRTYTLDHLTELDIRQADPAPDVGYVLHSPSLAAFYPRPAHHQFPGSVALDVGTVGEATRKVMAELEMKPASFHEFQHDREVSVAVEIVYDRTLPWRRAEGRRKAIHDLNRERERAATVATTFRGRVKVPARVHGATKAEALARRDVLIGELVAKLVPPHTVVCSACQGQGYIS